MNKQSAGSLRKAAFTLVELLTVIAIIAILMAMLFPAYSGIKDHARNKKAEGDIRMIAQAVAQFQVDYGQYPRLTSSLIGATDESCGDPVASAPLHNAVLFNILRAIDAEPNLGHSQNPRRNSYLETKLVSNPAAPRDGFLDGSAAAQGKGVKGALYDPWGAVWRGDRLQQRRPVGGNRVLLGLWRRGRTPGECRCLLAGEGQEAGER